MKYFEFGQENEKTLLLLHGVFTTWKTSFEKLIEIAKEKYYFQHKIFAEKGHGSLLLEPEKLLEEINDAYAGYII